MSKWLEGQVVGQRQWTQRLYSILIDAPVEPWKAGQFGRIGLHIDGQDVMRPYSFVNAPHERPLEFYYITVEGGPLTARLPHMKTGEKILVAPKASGFLVLSEAPAAENLWLLSTGTALGPFLAICKTEEAWSRFKHIVLVHAVRHAEELSYQDQIKAVAAQRGEAFKFVPFVSREDTSYAIKGRVPNAIEQGLLQSRTGVELSPEKSQIMICGNPEMVKDTQTMLESKGFRRHKRREPGHIHVETYW